MRLANAARHRWRGTPSVTVSPLNSALLGPLLSDAETAALFSDEAMIAAMLEFESALARVEERIGAIPSGSATAITAAARSLEPDPRLLGTGSAESGHPVATLVGLLREQSGPAGDYVHHGATAQDVIDTALVLGLREAVDRFDSRLGEIADSLAEVARLHRNTVMAGRTRSQQAVPVPFGLKAAGWLAPLGRHRKRLAELRPRALAVQLGGAAGTLGVLARHGNEIMDGLAHELGLAAPPTPWHTQRDGLAELAGWLSLVSGSLAKMGQDLVLLAQTEVGEAGDGSDGGSSAMPQKSNPVRSEVLVAIGRANAGLLGTMHLASIQEHERSGSAWTLEWLTLPQMAVLTGASLRLGLEVARSIDVNAERMLRNIESSSGIVLAEAAAIALSKHRSLEEARRIVASASRTTRATGESLIDVLARETRATVDWAALRDPTNWLGSADAFIERAIKASSTP